MSKEDLEKVIDTSLLQVWDLHEGNIDVPHRFALSMRLRTGGRIVMSAMTEEELLNNIPENLKRKRRK